MTEATALEQLKSWSACREGYDFVEAKGCKTMAEVWECLERPDWMVWCMRQAKNFDVNILRRWALECAKDAEPLYAKKYPVDMRVKECLQATEDYLDGKISAAELKVKRDAAYAAAAYAAYAAYAADAAYAAAAYAAYAAYAADAAYAAYAARNKKRKQYADLLRKMHPNPWRNK